MVDFQWNIFRAQLDPGKGSEQAGKRPVLVISSEEVNQALPIVTILSLTSVKPGRKVYSIETLLKASESGLPKDSIAMAYQIRAISKERLSDKIGSIDSEDARGRVRVSIKTYLDL